MRVVVRPVFCELSITITTNTTISINGCVGFRRIRGLFEIVTRIGIIDQQVLLF
jgi:hypothetical protein